VGDKTMEKKKIEVNESSVKRLISFFDLLGYEVYSKELTHRWNKFVDAVRCLENLYSNAPTNLDDYHSRVMERVTEYNNTLCELKKTFAYYIAKTAVMTDEEKWRRGGV
jgi:hypothetical protein